MTAFPSSGLQFSDVISLEDDASIFNFKMKHHQIPIYLFVRHFVLQAMVNKYFDLDDYSPKPNYSIKRIFLFVFYSLLKNLFFAPRKEIYIFSSEIVYKKNNSGKYYNSLYQTLFETYPQKSCIITHSFFKEFFHPKSVKAYHRDLIYLLANFIGIFTSISKADQKTINNFLKHLEKTLTTKLTPSDYEYIRTILKQNVKTTKTQMLLYTFFFKLKRPKLIIVEDAHYLNGSIHMLLAAKALGIKTAEYQHGYVGVAHRAYNYSKIAKKYIGAYLPEYFLTYGKYWSDMVNTPSQKIVVGKDISIKKKSKQNNTTKKILFISSGAKHLNLISLITTFHNKVSKSNFTIILRPHPSERSQINSRYQKLKDLNIEIDIKNLNDRLVDVNFVVGIEPSTVLYEALLFTPSVYLHKSMYTDYYEKESIFMKFINAEELYALTKEERSVNKKVDEIWDMNIYKNYTKLIDAII